MTIVDPRELELPDVGRIVLEDAETGERVLVDTSDRKTRVRYASEVGLPPGFSILDRGDSEDMIGLVRGELALDRKERRFPRKQTLGEIFSMAVNKGTTVVELVEAAYPHLMEELPDLMRVYAGYTEFKASKGLLDYDDLLVKLRDALVAHAALTERLARQYRYLMVDRRRSSGCSPRRTRT